MEFYLESGVEATQSMSSIEHPFREPGLPTDPVVVEGEAPSLMGLRPGGLRSRPKVLYAFEMALRRLGLSSRKTLRVLFAACCMTIAVLSLLPGDLRPHSGAPGPVEHVFAYAGTGFVLGLAFRSKRERLIAWMSLALFSGVFEILQNFVPDRGPKLLDALASTAGLTLGAACGAVVAAALSSRRRLEDKNDADP